MPPLSGNVDNSELTNVVTLDTNDLVRLALDFPTLQANGIEISPSKDDGSRITFTRGKEVYEFSPELGCYFCSPMVDESVSSVFFIVKNYHVYVKGRLIDRITFDYSCLARFPLPRHVRKLSSIKPKFFLDASEIKSYFRGEFVRIDRLRRTSDDGKGLLLDIDVPGSADSNGMQRLRRQTYWYIFKTKRLVPKELGELRDN